MKQVNPKYYLVAATLCLLLLIGAIYHCYMADFSNSEETQYVYIDSNDNMDSIRTKLQPKVTNIGLMAFNTLARFTNYPKHIKTGRYAIKPHTSVLTTFRNIKNGHQEPVRLTIPESRTMDRLAGALSRKLMLDSAVVAAVQGFCLDAVGTKGLHLVFHQADERGDDDNGSRKRQGRNLVADTLTSACRHEHQSIVS